MTENYAQPGKEAITLAVDRLQQDVRAIFVKASEVLFDLCKIICCTFLQLALYSCTCYKLIPHDSVCSYQISSSSELCRNSVEEVALCCVIYLGLGFIKAASPLSCKYCQSLQKTDLRKWFEPNELIWVKPLKTEGGWICAFSSMASRNQTPFSSLFLPLQFKCCGSNNSHDWTMSVYISSKPADGRVVPDSCCKTITPHCGKRDHPSNIYKVEVRGFLNDSRHLKSNTM